VELAETELHRAQRYDRPFSIIELDLDHFKSVNDTWGHDVGDQALQAVVETMRQTLREQDVCGRMGGEEFAALLPETDKERAVRAAERVRANVADTPVRLGDGTELNLTVSVGVASLSDGVAGFEELLKRADVALYEAKAEGRDRVKVAD
jgi:diguanylate cyclase (GGDEF)-like protein